MPKRKYEIITKDDEYNYVDALEQLIEGYQELQWLLSEYQGNDSEKGYLPASLMSGMNQQLSDYVAGMLSEQDMMDIAAYYSIQTISKNSANADAETLELGRKIYVGGKMDTQTTACIACHGAKGLGIPTAGFPAISAQHAEYTAAQLKAFRQYSINEQTGSTDVSRANEMMVNVAKGLTTVEIEALSQYIAGLH